MVLWQRQDDLKGTVAADYGLTRTMEGLVPPLTPVEPLDNPLNIV
jgi:hypothetical protein